MLQCKNALRLVWPAARSHTLFARIHPCGTLIEDVRKAPVGLLQHPGNGSRIEAASKQKAVLPCPFLQVRGRLTEPAPADVQCSLPFGGAQGREGSGSQLGGDTLPGQGAGKARNTEAGAFALRDDLRIALVGEEARRLEIIQKRIQSSLVGGVGQQLAAQFRPAVITAGKKSQGSASQAEPAATPAGRIHPLQVCCIG